MMFDASPDGPFNCLHRCQSDEEAIYEGCIGSVCMAINIAAEVIRSIDFHNTAIAMGLSGRLHSVPCGGADPLTEVEGAGMHDENQCATAYPCRACEDSIRYHIDRADLDEVIAAADRSQDRVAPESSIDLGIVGEVRIDIRACEKTAVGRSVGIDPCGVEIEFSKQSFPAVGDRTQKSGNSFAEDRMAVPSSKPNVTAALEEHVTKAGLEIAGHKVVRRDSIEHNHPHSASDIVSDQVGTNSAFDIGDGANGNRFSGVEVGCRDDTGQTGPDRSELLGARKGFAKVGERTRVMSFRLVV
jgi:hypothetical protein